MVTKKTPAKKAPAKKAPAKKATAKKATAKKATTKKTPATARPVRPPVVLIEVDASSSPETLFQAGRQRLPFWQDKAPRKAERRAEAIALLRRAAEAGHPEALEHLADFDTERAFEWAVVAAKGGEPRFLTSRMTDADHSADGVVVLDAARRAEPWAMFALGLVYGMGMADTRTGELVATRDGAWGWLPGVKDPEAEGVRWITQAADAGFAAAALDLATDLRHADAFDAALARARQAAAGALSHKKRTRLARLIAQLLDDLEAPLSEQLAVRGELAEGGDEDALVWLATRARDGDGVPRDVARARALFERAAAVGSVDGCRELGRMCEEGLGGPVDDERARVLYEQAAELGGDAFARDRLATKFGLTWYARGADE